MSAMMSGTPDTEDAKTRSRGRTRQPGGPADQPVDEPGKATDLRLTGKSSILLQLTKRRLEPALDNEMTNHVARDKHDRPTATPTTRIGTAERDCK